jgi:uncharacterized protein YggE
MDTNRSSSQSIKAIAAGAALVALVFALLLAGPVRLGGNAAAQDQDTPAPTPTLPATIDVAGHGAVTLAPDTASVSLGVTINEETLAAAQAAATARMAAILAAVQAAGVEDRDIKTTSYRVDLMHDRDDNGNPTRVIGYQVRNTIAVKVRDLDALGALLDAVVAEGATDVYGVSFFVDDPSAAASQARQLAVEDAMGKANELATAAGVAIARVTYITETYAPPPAPRDFAGDAAAAAPLAEAVPVQAGSTEISVDVQMTFELGEQAG